MSSLAPTLPTNWPQKRGEDVDWESLGDQRTSHIRKAGTLFDNVGLVSVQLGHPQTMDEPLGSHAYN